MIWIEDEHGETEYMNKLGEEVTQLSLSEINEGKWKKLIHETDLPKIVREMKHAFKKQIPYTIEYRLRKPNDEYSWYLETAKPVTDKGGVHWIATATNIDEQKKVEEQKSDFLAVVTHELKTPLTSLKAFAQILEQRFIAKNSPRKNAARA
jgi:PAS domain S-box-containing protein